MPAADILRSSQTPWSNAKKQCVCGCQNAEKQDAQKLTKQSRGHASHGDLANANSRIRLVATSVSCAVFCKQIAAGTLPIDTDLSETTLRAEVKRGRHARNVLRSYKAKQKRLRSELWAQKRKEVAERRAQ